MSAFPRTKSRISGCLNGNERNSPFFPLIRGVPPGSYRKGLHQDKILKSIPFGLERGRRYAFLEKGRKLGR